MSQPSSSSDDLKKKLHLKLKCNRVARSSRYARDALQEQIREKEHASKADRRLLKAIDLQAQKEWEAPGPE